MSEVLKLMGDKLSEARRKSGLTQKQVADYLGSTQVQLSYWETGTREINLSILEKLASLYGYTINYFLPNFDSTDPEIQIAFRADEISDPDIENIAWAKRFLNNLWNLNQMKTKVGL